MPVRESSPVEPPCGSERVDAGGSAPASLNGAGFAPPGRTEAAPVSEQLRDVDPADLVPEPTRWKRVAWYCGAIATSCVLLFAGLRLDAVDLHAPFGYDGDVLLILPMVKATVERGSHWQNERLGYPGLQELYDYPVIDHLHFAAIWLLGRFIDDWVTIFNLYYLLTYPLTVLTGMWALRVLRLTLPLAAVGGLLYSFTPYHYLRGEVHYFLSAFWVVPLSCLPALAICRGRFPFFRQIGADQYRPALRDWGSLRQVLLAAATASAGAYYAFFACMLYAFAGVYSWAVFRTSKAVVSAAALVTLVVAFGVVNHLPTIAYSIESGRNTVTERTPGEAELYGLKLTHLVLPVDGHHLTAFQRIKNRYNAPDRPLQNENACATLGAVASAGLIGLLVGLVLPKRRGWPYGPLAALVGFIVAYGMVGGIASFFNLLLFDQVRAPNRISIYLAFLCLFVALYSIDLFLVTRVGWLRRLRYLAAAALAGLGIVDQTPASWFSQHIAHSTEVGASRFRADRRFFTQIEDAMPAGSKVFNYPYIPYPEVPPLGAMNTYEHVRGYLHTKTLVWSYGSIKNREADAWQESVAHETGERLLCRLVVRGFDGLFVDPRGFAVVPQNEGEEFLADLQRLAAANTGAPLPVIRHEDGRQLFIDLRPYRDWLRRKDPARFEQWQRDEEEWCTITWLSGFYTNQPYGLRNAFRWAYPSGQAMIVNPSQRTRVFLFSALFGVEAEGEFAVRIDGSGVVWVNAPDGKATWSDRFTLTKSGGEVPRAYLIEVPPGRHSVRFRCTLPPRFTPNDFRPLCYYVRDIRFTEVK